MRETGLESLLTPALILDADIMAANCARMRKLARDRGVLLRPHAKTAKSIEALDSALDLLGDAVSDVVRNRREASITVSTLAEAEFFARAGYGDILYAVGISPNKFEHVERVMRDSGANVTLITDNVEVARAAVEYAEQRDTVFKFLLELDSGEHRGGVPCAGEELLEAARMLHKSPSVIFRGVMTHAGHSYKTDMAAELVGIAEDEVRCAARSAEFLRKQGIPVEVVSVGSTPTAVFAESMDGVTEMRPGVFMFFDLDQMSRGICARTDIAVTVLASVIGHSRAGSALLLDAGGLALSKDLSANVFMPGVRYGLVCDPVTLEPLGDLVVSEVHQEHGTVPVEDAHWFKRLPVGSLVRIMPDHACMTAAAYTHYNVMRGGRLVERCERTTGW